ncbi:hypothetical protein VTK73DRAFT_3976 [Phialemonium thermophilum]|uniref:Amidoligase enzyme n=1 Tax=Phialemonium thermophilum TaxID=223376 RepID=A0ABR3WVX8_9PEZI
MDVPGPFQFGIEIELLLGTRKKSQPTWKSLARDVSKRLQKAGLANHVKDGSDKSAETYNEWSIVQEVTIPSQPGKNLWGIELVSPIYPVYSYWAGDLNILFSTLQSSYTLVPSPHCSTHIHLSGVPEALTAIELAGLAKAALYFESALDCLVPPARRGSRAYWCQTLRASSALLEEGVPRSLRDCLAIVDDAAAVAGSHGVVEAVNLFSAASTYGQAHGMTADFVRGKVYKWNLAGMIAADGLGTVEFRQPLGCLAACDAVAWATLTLAFVASAVGELGLGLKGDDVGEEGGSVGELWEFLVAGARSLGWDGIDGVEQLFARED